MPTLFTPFDGQCRSTIGSPPDWNRHTRPYISAPSKPRQKLSGSTLGLAINLPDAVGRRVVAEGGRRIGLLDIKGQARTSLFHALAEGQGNGLGSGGTGSPHSRPDHPWPVAFGGNPRAGDCTGLKVLHAQRISAIEVYKRVPTYRELVFRLGMHRSVRRMAECEERDSRVFSFNDADGETSLEHPNGTLSWAPYVGR